VEYLVSPISAADSLALAKKHLERVQSSWDPPEWLDLAAYGLYALEAAVVAAALHCNVTLKRTHTSKADAADELSNSHGLPEISDLMQDLNEVRKSEAYGDISARPTLDPEDVASQVEEYIDAVSNLLAK
jgi:hypothetical protein